MNDNDQTNNCENVELYGSALAAFEHCCAIAGWHGSPPEFVESLREYLCRIQEWVPRLLEPMPNTPLSLELSFYSVFVNNFLAQSAEDFGRRGGISVTSPKHARELIDKGVAGARKLSSLYWRMIGTGYALQEADSQKVRSEAAAKFNQEMTVEFLRAILPLEHFEAVSKLGIDAAKWRREGYGFGFGLHSHIDWLINERNRIAETFRVETKKRRASDQLFVNDLADLWRVGVGSEPTTSINRDHDTTSPFCDFVGACWKVAELDRPAPSADTIARMMKRKS